MLSRPCLTSLLPESSLDFSVPFRKWALRESGALGLLKYLQALVGAAKVALELTGSHLKCKYEVKTIKGHYVYAPVPQDEYIYYVSQTYMNKKI